MGRRLYVGNLPYTTGEAELQELFSKAGTVESVRVMRDAATGRPRADGQRSAAQARRRIRRRRRRRLRRQSRRRRRRRTSRAALVTLAPAARARTAKAPQRERHDDVGGEHRITMKNWAKGDRVVQPTYGPGTLVEVNEHHTVIDFDEHGRRVFATRLVVLQATNEPAPAKAARKRAAKTKPKEAKEK